MSTILSRSAAGCLRGRFELVVPLPRESPLVSLGFQRELRRLPLSVFGTTRNLVRLAASTVRRDFLVLSHSDIRLVRLTSAPGRELSRQFPKSSRPTTRSWTESRGIHEFRLRVPQNGKMSRDSANQRCFPTLTTDGVCSAATRQLNRRLSGAPREFAFADPTRINASLFLSFPSRPKIL